MSKLILNDCDDIRKVMSKERVDCALIQYTRQKPDDRYKLKEVIDTIKEQKDIPIITDDNYRSVKGSFYRSRARCGFKCFFGI